MRPLPLRALTGALLVTLVTVAACGSPSKTGTSDAAADRAASGEGGAGGAVGNGSGGGGGPGGATVIVGTGGGTGTADGGTQPIGAACANTANCSQADGTAVCCLSISTCVLDTQCPAGTTYVSCDTQPCAKSGWVCCNAGGMHFCTKQSACP